MTRIISLLPSATEILSALKSADQIIGGEDLIKTKIKQSWSSKYIDQTVSQSLRLNQSLYQVNNEKFVQLKPDLVITQKLCEVCSITPTDIQAAIRDCQTTPEIKSLHPHSIKDILEDILTLGRAIDKETEALGLVKSLKHRIKKIADQTKNLTNRPTVYCMEWLDPPYNAGHWVPEQVKIAGGKDDLATKGIDSIKLLWQKITDYNPDFMILMPCGFDIVRTRAEINILTQNPAWSKLESVKKNQVFLVNGPKYFNSSGPGVIDGIELITKIIHPEISTRIFSRTDLQQL